jgi:hypothetical protein
MFGLTVSGSVMKIPVRAALAALALVLAAEGAQAQATGPGAKDATAMTRAVGTFEVKLAPQPTDTPVGRMSIDKQFHGDLHGVSRGEMLAVQGAVEGSAAYVALERVTGSLAGRTGTFMLQHTGIMNRGTPSLTITVVPDSGTEELAGLTGTMKITIAEGRHSYEFDYALTPSTKRDTR